MPQRYAVAGVEPPLEELLTDPITQLVMQRDGIDVAEVRRALAAGLARLVGAGDADRAADGAESALELPHGASCPAG